jgi:hypothetical protein
LKDLRPRGPAPALAAPRILVLACMIWTSLVCLVFLLGYSSLWLGRTWCSSVKRENFNRVSISHIITRISLQSFICTTRKSLEH